MTNDIHSHKEKKKWTTFTSVGKEVYHITKVFRKQNLCVALKNKNKISKSLNRNKDKQNCQKYRNNGVYQLWCKDCPLVYIGQTGRQFQMKFKEHSYKNIYTNSTYAQHLMNHGYFLGHVEDIMDVIFTTYEGKHLDTVEKYHMYQKTEKGIQINDRITIAKKYLT